MHTRFRTALLAAAALAVATFAAALDLDQAKAQGLLGEQRDGYVGVVAASAPADAKALAEDVNAKRRAAYAKIARQNGAPLADVAALAGKKLIEGAPSGTWVRLNGQWQRKP